MSAPAANRSRTSCVDRVGVGHRERPRVAVVVVLRLLGHRERPGHGHLDRPVGVRPEELEVARRWIGPRPARSGPTTRGTGLGCAAAVQRLARVVDVDAVQRGGEVVGVALPADLAVGDDVEPGLAPGPGPPAASRRPGPRRGTRAPVATAPGAHPRREPAGQLGAVDQPVRLRRSCPPARSGTRDRAGTSHHPGLDGVDHEPAPGVPPACSRRPRPRPAGPSRAPTSAPAGRGQLEHRRRAPARAAARRQRVVGVAEDAVRPAAQRRRGRTSRSGPRAGCRGGPAGRLGEHAQRGGRGRPEHRVDDEVDRPVGARRAAAARARRRRRRPAGRTTRSAPRSSARSPARGRRLAATTAPRAERGAACTATWPDRRRRRRAPAPARRPAARRARSAPSRPPPRTARAPRQRRPARRPAAARSRPSATTAASARLPSPGRIPASVVNHTRVPLVAATTPTPCDARHVRQRRRPEVRGAAGAEQVERR